MGEFEKEINNELCKAFISVFNNWKHHYKNLDSLEGIKSTRAIEICNELISMVERMKIC